MQLFGRNLQGARCLQTYQAFCERWPKGRTDLPQEKIRSPLAAPVPLERLLLTLARLLLVARAPALVARAPTQLLVSAIPEEQTPEEQTPEEQRRWVPLE